VISLLIGVPLGLWAGYKGGRVDEVVMRALDLMMSIPPLLLGLLILALAPRFDRAMAGEPLARKGAAFGLGVLAFVLLPIVAVLLLAIVIAVPLGLFVLLGLALIYTVGYVAGAHVVGRAIVKSPRSRFVAFLAGWAILRVIALVPILGGICWILATMVGLGALLLAARAAPDRTPAMPDGEPLPAV
jgi:ABC-type dipeptide/oligopeptide/nickel transport system permease subunit